jgi:hypothetical protein
MLSAPLVLPDLTKELQLTKQESHDEALKVINGFLSHDHILAVMNCVNYLTITDEEKDKLRLRIALKTHPWPVSSAKTMATKFETKTFERLGLEKNELNSLKDLDLFLLSEPGTEIETLEKLNLVNKLTRLSNQQRDQLRFSVVYHNHQQFQTLTRLLYLYLD